MGVVLIVVVVLAALLGVAQAQSRMRQTGKAGGAARKCSFCGRRLKIQPGTGGMKVATVCGRCGRTQPWAA